MSWKRFITAFDVHGDEQDPVAVKAFFNFCDAWKPDDRILGGDLYNFAALRKNASAEEKRDSLQNDYSKGSEFRDRFKPTKYIRGNHCERLWDWRDVDSGPVSDLCGAWCSEIEKSIALHKCIMVPYGKKHYLPIGGDTKTYVTHGCSHGGGAARNTAIAFATVGDVLMGHIHQFQSFTLPTLGHPRTAMTSGSLCYTDQEYNRAHLGTLAQQNGWFYGVWNTKTKEVITWSAKRTSSGKFAIPSDIQML